MLPLDRRRYCAHSLQRHNREKAERWSDNATVSSTRSSIAQLRIRGIASVTAFRSIPAMIDSISAITLATHNMSRAVRFYCMLGFEIVYGGEDAAFTSFRAGTSYLNLIAQPAERDWSWWGRVIFYHSDVDALHANVIAAGYAPDTAPRDAEWGERFFHVTDPDGHELSFAWPSHRQHIFPHSERI